MLENTTSHRIIIGRNTLMGLLIFIMIMKIVGYFTLFDSLALTRVVKIIMRCSVTGFIWLIYRYLKLHCGAVRFRYDNLFVLLFYLGYLLLGFYSFMWTTKIAYSALQWVMDLESIVFVYFLIKTLLLYNQMHPDTPVRFNLVIAHTVTLIMIGFVVGMFVNPDKFYRLTHGGEVARLGGYLMNPNELGMLIVIGAAAIYLEFYRRQNYVLLGLGLLILMWTLVLTGSRSSSISFMLVTLFFITLSESMHLKVLVIAGIVLAIPFVVNVIFLKMGDLEEVLSMTGRIPFWKALLTEGLPKEPLFGFGFMRIAYGDKFESVHTYAAGMTHNTFIQVLMNLGLVGGIIVLFQLISTIRAMIVEQNRHIRILCIGFFIPLFINSVTEFGIFGETNYAIMFYQILIFLLVMRISDRYTPLEQLRRNAMQKYLQKKIL